MTVGITLDNGIEALVVTDSRVSGAGRQSDSSNKLGVFSKDNYHGTVFGAGSANLALSVIDRPQDFEGAEIDGYVDDIQKQLNSLVDVYDKQVVERGRIDTEKKAVLYTDEADRKRYINDENTKVLQALERNQTERQTQLVLVAYDTVKKSIRKFSVNLDTHLELFIPHHEIGSGADGAHWYFSTKLQGADPKKLKSEDLAFFGVNGYSQATVNFGVGGIPKIAFVTKDGVRVLSPEQACALANLSGAYLAEFDSLTTHSVRRHFKDVLSEERPRYAAIARTLGMNRDAFTGTVIPYSSWQEQVNTKRYGK